MRIKVCAIGKPKLAYAKAALQEYAARLERYTRLELVYLKEGSQMQEGERLLQASEGYLRVVLDERGEAVDTAGLRARLESWEMRGEKGAAFLVGGAAGHSQMVREAADWVLSLSKLTLQHELALVVLLEQVYRVETLKRGEPYHR